MNRERAIMGLAITFSIAILVWFGGWAVWTQFHLWDTVQNVEYENALYLVMFLTVVFGSGLTLRKSKVPEMESLSLSSREVYQPPQNPLDLGPVNKRLDEIAGKVAEIHMAMTFMKKVKEKDGEKP